MSIEVENALGMRKATIGRKRIMEINKEKSYVLTVDGERYEVTPTAIESLLKILESR